MEIDKIIEKVKYTIENYGGANTLMKINCDDINAILNQLELQENYNDMLVQELEDLKQENKDLHFKNDVIENICLQHQELTQWIEEEIDNEPETRIYEVSHDFLENLYERVHKLNHEPY